MKATLIAISMFFLTLGVAAQKPPQGIGNFSSENKEDIQSTTKVYPVPVKDGILNIRTTKEIRSIRITNIIGQPIFNQNYDYSPLFVKLETGAPPPGI